MTDQLFARRRSGVGPIQRWFLRGRVFRIAIQVRMLVLASLGVLFTIFGWWCSPRSFPRRLNVGPLLPSRT